MLGRVSLYRPESDAVDANAIADWLRGRLTADVTVRDPFPLDPSAVVDRQVADPDRPRTGPRTSDDVEGRLYDGRAVQRACNAALDAAGSDRSLSHCRVALLDLPLATWGNDRWHRRVSVLGRPAVVSVPGLWSAPAKPTEYYWHQRRYARATGEVPPEDVLAERVEAAFLRREDPRTTEALKGYVLQAVHYLATGEAFCDDERCRLHNAHRHEGVVRAQLDDPEFCEDHARRYG
ncbi:DUF7001 family protein [Halomicrococcus sp. NG-SE-24]|uniref:DUF7001 family protein n=1 Tax=Halomicrococcus sp. NG-SE-24 TaxID=3436928 RepID=UPI003D99D479